MRYLLCCCLVVGAACGSDETSSTFRFPPGFEWGTASAGFQVESDNTGSDFARFEDACVLAHPNGIREPGETFTDCESNLDGPKFWELYEQDFAAAEAMQHNAIRLGIEWAKIEPQEGSYDAAALAHYHAIFAAARAHGLHLMLTLQHFTLPDWLHPVPEATPFGWPGADDTAIGGAPIVAAFARFAGDMAQEFGGDVDLWVTINEPIVLLAGGYLGGTFPPAQSLQVGRTLRGAFNMIYAHAAAYDAIHLRDLVDADGDGDAASVSIAHHWRAFDPYDATSTGDIESAARLDYVFNRLFVDAVTYGRVDLNADGDIDDAGESIDPALEHRLDWLGVNYYGRQLVHDSIIEYCEGGACADDEQGVRVPIWFQENDDPKVPHNDLGWEVYPHGLVRVLADAQTYGLDIRITENGMADGDDDDRPAFIISHLHALELAMAAGARVLGYYHWSLTDNFEWVEGYAPRFGLLTVDYTSPERTRTPTRGAQALTDVIEERAVNAALVGKYGTLGEDAP